MTPKEAFNKILFYMKMLVPPEEGLIEALKVFNDLVNQPRTVAEIRADIVDKLKAFPVNFGNTYTQNEQGYRDALIGLLDFIDGKGEGTQND